MAHAHEGELPPRWSAALAAFDADMRRRALADKTRRAYGGDLARFAAWCASRGLGPGAATVRDLRRYAASLSAGGLRPTSVARAIASLRAFHAGMRERGEIAHNPAELLT